jgi:hypothetical protein
VLLGREARERLEDMGEVGRAARQRPLLHRLGHRVREREVEGLPVLERRLELLVDVAWQEVLLHRRREDVGSEWVVVGLGQVDGSEGLAIGAPAGRKNVLRAGLDHRRGSLLSRLGAQRAEVDHTTRPD